MFCPYCGSQMADDAAFCTDCGKKIVAGTPAFAAQSRGSGSSQKKMMIIAAAVVCVIAVAVFIINISKGSESKPDAGTNQSISSNETKPSVEKKEGYQSMEELFDALFAAACSKDVEGVIACFPKEMEPFAKKLFNAYRNDNYKYSAEYPGAGLFGFINLNPDNEYSYEIVKATNLDSGEESPINYYVTKESLQADFGLTVDEIYFVELATIRKFAGGSDGVRSYPQVARIGNYWYLVRGHDLWLSDWFE